MANLASQPARLMAMWLPTWTNAKSVAFDGTANATCVAANNTLFNLQPPFTMSAWVRQTAATTGNIANKYTASGNLRQYRWQIGSNRIVNVLVSTDGTLNANKNYSRSFLVAITLNEWAHVAWSMNTDGLINCYQNNVLVNSGTAPFTTLYTGTATFRLGTESVSTNPLTGNIDSVSIWGAVLTAPEISQVYYCGRTRNLLLHPQASNLSAWWRLGDGDTAPTLLDSSGAGNSLTMAAGASIVSVVP